MLPSFNRETLCNCCVETVSWFKLTLRLQSPECFISCSRQTGLWTSCLCEKWEVTNSILQVCDGLSQARCHSGSVTWSVFRMKQQVYRWNWLWGRKNFEDRHRKTESCTAAGSLRFQLWNLDHPFANHQQKAFSFLKLQWIPRPISFLPDTKQGGNCY